MSLSKSSLGPVVERGVPLAEQIVQAILRGATERTIPFGSRLVEAEIAKDFNVSRVPVRDALHVLLSQGIVENSSSRGMCLMQVDQALLEEMLLVRLNLETLAVKTAVARLKEDPSRLSELEAAVERMRLAWKSGAAADMAASDVGFHRAIINVAGNATLKFLWETLSRKIQIIVGIAWYATDQERIYRQHVDFLKLFREGQVQPLLRFLEPHILEGVSLGVNPPLQGQPAAEVEAVQNTGNDEGNARKAVRKRTKATGNISAL